MRRFPETIPPQRSARVARRLVAALAALAAGCAKPGSGANDFVRLLDAPRAAMVDVAGEARLALRVAAGEVTRCTVALPAAPCWLDVAAAALSADPARALDGVVLDVVRVAGGARATLLHALLDAGTKPTAFGWGHARIECTDHLGETVALEFRVEPAPGAAPPSDGFALALPHLSPRADANDRAWLFVDWLGAGPTSAELDEGSASQRWPGYRRLLAAVDGADVVGAAPTGEGAGRRPVETTSPAAIAADAFELQAFGSEDPGDPGETARRVCDRFARVDPFARDGDDPALRGLATLEAARRADRPRALGERTLQIELARPRRAPCCVEVTSLRDGATCDAALARLLDFLSANQRLDRTLLLVRTRPAGGGRGLVVARLPSGWRDHAPAALVARFDERAPEFRAR